MSFLNKLMIYILNCLLIFSISIALSSCGGKNKVDTPYGSTECIGKEINSVKSDFEASGFSNISEEEINDLDITEKDKYGIVESVSINGVSDFKGNEEFKNLSKVLIKYHSFKTIDVPFSANEAKNMNVESIINAFKNVGFVDITTDEVYDIDPDENIEFENEIIINKTNSFEKSNAFPQNAQIKITTHKPYKKYTLKVIIDFIPNLLFSKYDVDFKVANNIETLEHGKDGEFEYRLKEGEYTLIFKSAESSSINGNVKINLTGDTEVSYKIECDDDKVDIETLYIENKGEIGENEAMIPANSSDYAYGNYQEVEKAFKEAGFTNVKTEALYDIVLGWTEEGEIEKISVDGKTEFKRGDILTKDCPIIITYHLDENDRPVGENETRVPSDSYDWQDEYYDVVEKSLKEAGFTNIKFETISYNGLSKEEEGLVDFVTINGITSFDKGDIFEKNAEIIITYCVVKEYNTKTNLTISNNEDFALLMQITDQTDATTIQKFVNSHKGDVIEFNGCIALMMNHENYKTRFDVCIAGGDYDAGRLYGPLFAFEDVNYYDMNVSGSDTVAEGMNFKITAKIKGFSKEGGYILLTPIALDSR